MALKTVFGHVCADFPGYEQEAERLPRKRAKKPNLEGDAMKLRLLIAMATVLVAGCATKNYGRQGELTGYERDTMTCREIDLEVAKVHGFLTHVDKESQFDGRSVLSFLGDFGVGNVLEKSSAVDSATSRLAQLQDLRSRRGCGTVASNAARSAPQPAPAPASTQFGRYSYAAENLPEVRACNPYPAPKLNAQGPGFEKYTVACADGDALSLQCEGGGCRVLR